MAGGSVSSWLRNARSVSLAQSVLPGILAVVLAAGRSGFSILYALAAVFGAACAHLGMNLADDYFDYKADMLSDRDRVVRKGFRAMMLKYPYLTDGSQTPRSLLRAIACFFGLAALCGAAVFFGRGAQYGFLGPDGSWWVPAICLAAGFLGIFYSAPPLKLAYRGLGEPVIGLIFGPLLMTGVYYASCGEVDSEVVWVSLPVGVLVMNILYTHSFVEKDSDEESNKMTLARLIGSYARNVRAAVFINLLPYVLVVVAVSVGYLHPAYLVLLVVVPRSVWLCRSLYEYASGHTEVPSRPSRGHGRMPRWEQMNEAGVGWFMMRWLASRNILVAFCTIAAAVRLVLMFTVN